MDTMTLIQKKYTHRIENIIKHTTEMDFWNNIKINKINEIKSESDVSSAFLELTSEEKYKIIINRRKKHQEKLKKKRAKVRKNRNCRY